MLPLVAATVLGLYKPRGVMRYGRRRQRERRAVLVPQGWARRAPGECFAESWRRQALRPVLPGAGGNGREPGHPVECLDAEACRPWRRPWPGLVRMSATPLWPSSAPAPAVGTTKAPGTLAPGWVAGMAKVPNSSTLPVPSNLSKVASAGNSGLVRRSRSRREPESGRPPACYSTPSASSPASSTRAYALLRTLSELGFRIADHSVVCRHLYNLERRQLLTSDRETPSPGPARRVYRLTDIGWAILRTASGESVGYGRTGHVAASAKS